MSEEIIYSNIQSKSLYCCCKNGFVEATGVDNTPGSGVRQFCDILGGTVALCPESYPGSNSCVSCTTSADCPWWIKSAFNSPCAERGETIHGPYASSTEATDDISYYQPCSWGPVQGNCVSNECVQP